MSRPLITVNALTAQLRERGAIELPAEALITPAAADWLRGTRVTVRHSAPSDDGSKSTGGPLGRARGPVIYLAGDPHCAVLQTLRPMLERQHGGLKFVACSPRPPHSENRPTATPETQLAAELAGIHEVCAGLAGCSRRCGVMLARHSAVVACVANRFSHVRAAIVDRPTALYGLLHGLGANLLIIEPERIALRQIQALCEELLRGAGEVEPAIAAALQQCSAASAPLSGGNGHGGGCGGQCKGCHSAGGCTCGSGGKCPCRGAA